MPRIDFAVGALLCRLQAFQQMPYAFVDFLLRERFSSDDVFPHGAIGQPVSVVLDKVKHDRAFVIPHSVDHHARRPIKAVPAAVVAANQPCGVNGRRDTFPPPLHTELIVH